MYNYGKSTPRIGDEDREGPVHVRAVFGQNIGENPVPTETSDRTHAPFVVFEDPDSGMRIGLNKDSLSLGLLALAAPGGGKTNLVRMILARLLATIAPGDVIIILDTKGDYFAEFGSRIPAENRVVVGSGSCYQSVTAYHNIFAEIMPRGNDGRLVYTGRDCDVDALEMTEHLFQQMKSETQPVFPAMAEQISAAVMIYFMRTYWRDRPSMLNNRQLVDYLQSAETEDLIRILELEYMKDQRSCISYIKGKGNQTQGVLSYIGAVFRKIFIGPFAQSCPQREFSMREIVTGRQTKIVFIEYDLIRGNTLAPMYGLLCDQGMKYGLGGRGGQRKNVYLLLDEWALLSELKYAGLALSFGRTQGLKLMAGLQNISAIENIYGEAGAKNILAGFQNIFAFKITDHETRRFMVDRLGENYQNLSFRAGLKDLSIQRSGHTVEEWDLMALEKGQAVVTLADRKPFLFKLPLYQ